MITRTNSQKYFLQEENLKSYFSITSHLSRQDATKQISSIFETNRISQEQSTFSVVSAALHKKEEDCQEEKQLIIVMFSKRRKIKIFKTIKRLFSFIIACYFKSLNTIQSFREVKRRNRLTLRDFHHIFQDAIAARQKNLELDSDYNSFSFKLFSSIISDQIFRKSTFDSFNDIDLFDLEIRSSSSLKSLNKSFDKHVSLKQFISLINSSKNQSSRNQSFRSYERKHQDDLSI